MPSKHRIYCAGPLFNSKERLEMSELAAALEQAGYETFLPQRDGLELSKCVEALQARGFAPDEAGELMAQAIFSLDVFQVLHGCDGVLANLNGRVPDEGTVSEAAMAWARGKPVVGYKTDSRSAFGGQDNPLVTGLFEFSLCQTIEHVLKALESQLHRQGEASDPRSSRERDISVHIDMGRAIWSALQETRDVESVVEVVMRERGHATVSQ